MAEPLKKPEVTRFVEIERRDLKPERMNVWASAPKNEWEYVTIPAEDLHGYSHPSIGINHDIFEAGQTYFVPPILAGEIRRIMDRHQIEQIALLQPKRRQKALRDLAGAQGATRVGTAAAGAVAIQEGLPGAAEPV